MWLKRLWIDAWRASIHRVKAVKLSLSLSLSRFVMARLALNGSVTQRIRASQSEKEKIEADRGDKVLCRWRKGHPKPCKQVKPNLTEDQKERERERGREREREGVTIHATMDACLTRTQHFISTSSHPLILSPKLRTVPAPTNKASHEYPACQSGSPTSKVLLL